MSGEKQKTMSPDRIRNFNLSYAGRVALTTVLEGTGGEQGDIPGSYITCLLHTARMSDVVDLVCYFR